MTMNPLPPQAYTKETMVKAYQWLQHQTDNIKEMATNPDILVSLYLKAKLQGDGALERPSIQNFKNELKNLAGMIGEFEVLEPTTPPPAPLPQAPPPHHQASVQTAAQPHPSPPRPRPSLDLDTKTLSMIHEVKIQLNLSSDLEALRLLISVGHCKVKALMSEK